MCVCIDEAVACDRHMYMCVGSTHAGEQYNLGGTQAGGNDVVGWGQNRLQNDSSWGDISWWGI